MSGIYHNFEYATSGRRITADDWNEEHVNRYDVRNYGAVGDGTTDDTAAIQAAIDSVYNLGGGEVVFPDGRFLVSKATDIDGIPPHAILLKPNVKLRGIGWAAATSAEIDDFLPGTVIQLVNDQYCNVISTITDTYHYGVAIRDLAIHGNKTECQDTYVQAECNGIYLTSTDRPIIERCLIMHCNGAAVYGVETSTRYAIQAMIIDCVIARNRIGVQCESGATDWLISNCDIGENSNSGLVGVTTGKGVILGSGTVLNSCAVWSNDVGIFGYGAWHCIINGTRVDYNIYNGLYLHGCRGMTISGCAFYCNSAVDSGAHSAAFISGDVTFPADSIVFSGCLLGDTLAGGEPDYRHKWGVELDSGSAGYMTNVEINGCMMTGNESGPYSSPDYVLKVNGEYLAGAAPLYQAWITGDRIRNNAPAAEEFIGWICLSGGTPGTWKGYGAIEA